MLIFALAYICVGIMVVSTAFELMGGQLRKLHNVGKKLRDVRAVKIWFGGNR